MENGKYEVILTTPEEKQYTIIDFIMTIKRHAKLIWIMLIAGIIIGVVVAAWYWISANKVESISEVNATMRYIDDINFYQMPTLGEDFDIPKAKEDMRRIRWRINQILIQYAQKKNQPETEQFKNIMQFFKEQLTDIEKNLDELSIVQYPDDEIIALDKTINDVKTTLQLWYEIAEKNPKERIAQQINQEETRLEKLEKEKRLYMIVHRAMGTEEPEIGDKLQGVAIQLDEVKKSLLDIGQMLAKEDAQVVAGTSITRAIATAIVITVLFWMAGVAVALLMDAYRRIKDKNNELSK